MCVFEYSIHMWVLRMYVCAACVCIDHSMFLFLSVFEYCIHTVQKCVWVDGCMGVWVYGCMGVWVFGCMGAWLYGVYGCVGVWVHLLVSALVAQPTIWSQ